ncbi:M20 family metallopeptidase [Aquibacillus koreensis]|uniref:M20 family metallopeptidase n=1 Tax=Aquibacillus koreensis TaxID=279446 RepID=A0A9X3WKE6_9BACI|nr:M20 family metallopeptidase [Aquibacillus koreensis]MCT2536324.1 M20 family metallopeptidase [Aquibacillus koreensis]MDC3421325.1 M20 family metallopeptidase [Aquibacillus koreensis]
MLNFLECHQEEMMQLLERLVNIDSGSYDKQGVDQIGNILTELYSALEFNVEVSHQEEFGNHLVIKHKDASEPKIIILAHMDTVFPKGTVAERPFRIQGDRAYGPGVIDMKASLVTLLYAIKALKNAQHHGYRNVQIVLNTDEEIGSMTSRPIIEKMAAGKKYALVMEPARKNGALVSARRGKGNYTIHVHGKAAHSGIEPEKGRSAIEELAHKVIQLHELSDPELGINVNVGMIEGGSSVNTISEHASAQIDIRISEMGQVETLEEKLEEICSSTDVLGTSVSLEGEFNRPPMQKTKKTEFLLKIIKEAGASIGVKIKDTATGGGSDASFTAALGIATIDGLGPVGGDAHSESEYLEIQSFVPRTLLLATIIERLTEKTGVQHAN